MIDGDLFIIAERDNYTPKIGLLVSLLSNARHYLLTATRDLSTAQLDAQPKEAPNTIGQLLAHLAAAELMFQAITFHDRQFNEEEAATWGAAFKFQASEKAKNRTLPDYLSDLDK